ncbi:unnamed protein product, partial [Laminaria digitata]
GGQDGSTISNTTTYPDGASEAGGCQKEDPIKRERELEEMARIFPELSFPKVCEFVDWFNVVKKTVDMREETFKRREEDEARRKEAAIE